MFGRLVVLLDDLAPGAGVFAQAVQWHRRLHVPLHAIALPAWRQPSQANDEEDPLRACAATCEHDGDALDITFTTGQLGDAWRLLHPDDLVLFGQRLPVEARTWLQRQALGSMAPAVLVCPDDCSPLTRVLVLDQADHSTETFLVGAVKLAAELQAAAVVLTVAPTEKAALARQQKARQALRQAELWADCDFVVGSEVGAAVAHVARWRRSQLIMLERPNLSSWRRWLRGNTLTQRFDEMGSLAVLSLPNERSRLIVSRSEVFASATR